MEVVFSNKSSLQGRLRVPGSKSYTHRAYLTAALLEGGKISHPLECDDTRATRLCLQGFNCEFRTTESGLEIRKNGGDLIRTDRFLAGESGTLLRFLLPVCTVGSGPEEVTISGRGSLKKRSNKIIVASIRENGFQIQATGEEATVPITCYPGQKLHQTPVRVDASTTSQLLSGWLLALAAAGGGEAEVKDRLVSAPYVDMTAEVLREAGVTVEEHDDKNYEVQPEQVCPLEYDVPGDYSAAAFFIAGAALAGDKVKLAGLRRKGRQADRRIVEIMSNLGADVQWEGEELVIEGPIQPSGFEVDASDCPDLVPVLAVVGSQASSAVKIKNISHLTNKESDRINMTCRELAKTGLKIIPGEDEININPSASRLHNDHVRLEAHNDHRLAMAFSILGICRGNLTVTGAESISKSYPDFYKDLASLEANFQKK